jgi:hypothetical protein
MSQAITVEDKKFGEMTIGEKIVYTGKVIIFLASFGFAYPNVLTDPNYKDGGRVKADAEIS